MDAELITHLKHIERLALLGAKNILTLKDVALLTGRSEKTIRNRLGEIPHHHGPMGVVFRRDEVENWLAAKN